jgi:ribosomal protein S18 acetylase RimI-like enzyme
MHITFRSGEAVLDDLEPLYRDLHEHQVKVVPCLTPIGEARAPEEAWRRRLLSYREWMSDPASFLVVATASREPLGYALVTRGAGYAGYASQDRIGEVKDLVVKAEHRMIGIGSALLASARGRLAREGITHIRLNVLASNHDAVAFYERCGMTVGALTMLGRTS